MVGDGVGGPEPARAHGLGKGGEEGGTLEERTRVLAKVAAQEYTRRIKRVSGGTASLPAHAGTAGRVRRVVTVTGSRRWD